MFWKKDKSHHEIRYSLSTRLMLLYALSTLSIFAAVCLYLYPTFLNLISHLSSNTIEIKIRCYKNIIIALLFSALGAITLGKLVAKNGLYQLQEFSQHIKKISADSLHERIHPDDWSNELKGLSIEFNSMLNRLQSSFMQLNQFSSDIAHELRNPLHNLQGITELALAKENLPSEYTNILESYMGEYQHLTKLVESLLFLSRSDQQQLALNKQLINARDEVCNIIDFYLPLAESKKVTMTCEGDASLRIDVTLFKRIINNILSNSLRYTPANGAIHICIKTADKQNVILSISDTGIGIEAKHLPHLFDRFYRIDTSRHAESGGLGLGLAIVKSIVELHKGTITVNSQPHQGTTVGLRFPI